MAEIVRKFGIAEQTFYRWKKQYGGLSSNQVIELKQLQEENQALLNKLRRFESAERDRAEPGMEI